MSVLDCILTSIIAIFVFLVLATWSMNSVQKSTVKDCRQMGQTRIYGVVLKCSVDSDIDEQGAK